MARMKRAITMAFAIIMIFTCVIISPKENVYGATTIKAGDYIQFGKYNNQTILWRVINFDENGNPLLFSEKVLSEKMFGGTLLYEEGYGYYTDNRWHKSAIRTWLNSNQSAGNVTYEGGYPMFPIDPVTGYDRGYVPHYDQEAGFLSANNFTTSEVSIILEKTQKNILSKEFRKEATGGDQVFNIGVYGTDQGPVSQMVGNYNQAYYMDITDRMFLLDIKQLEIVTQKYKDSFTGYYESKMTDYFLRTPDGAAGDLVMMAWCWSPYMDDISIRINEPAASTQSAKHGFGTRPAFYLNIEKAMVKSGEGTKVSPFTLTSGPSINSNQIYVKIGSKNVEFNNLYGFPFVDQANRTQVPLRITMESYGATVDFDAKTSTAIVTKNGVEVRVPIGQRYILKNGEKISIDTSAIIKNSRTYLPIRAVVEALAGKVTWDGVTKTVIIEDLSQ